MRSSLSTALSSHERRRGTAHHDDVDRSAYAAGQTLASIANDPRLSSGGGAAGGLFGAFGLGLGGGGHDALPSADEPPPPIDASKYPPVSLADVQDYLNVVSGAYGRFLKDRADLEALGAARGGGGEERPREAGADGDGGGEGGSGGEVAVAGGSGGGDGSGSGGGGAQQGEAILAALAAVPAPYFADDFEDNW